MRRKSRFRLPLLLIFALVTMQVLALVGCGSAETSDEEGYYTQYYLNAEGNQLVNRTVELGDLSADGLIQAFIDQLNESPAPDETSQRLFTEGVSIQSYSLSRKVMTLNMNANYQSMSGNREILVRAGLVRTFTQIEGIRKVAISVDGEPLRGSDGEEVGPLTRSGFVENSGKEINTYQNITLKLYFADENGDALTEEKRNVYYSTNVPVERVVVEELVKGPSEAAHCQVLSADTTILSVTIQDDICYVGFDESFSGPLQGLEERIPIYAIVDSLAVNCNVSKVQFSVNGGSTLTFGENISLDQLFEPDMTLIKEE